MILRRIIVGLLVLASALYGLLGARALDPEDDSAGTSTPGDLGAPVISPRRVPEVAATNIADAAMRGAVSQILGQAGADSCLDVERNGVNVASAREDLALVPASTTKLFTATAALEILGEDHTFKTRAVANDVDDGVITGPLYLVGGGDPVLVTDDYFDSLPEQPDVYTRLERLADEVVEAGVREIRGGISADDRRFDGQRGIATWDPGYLRQAQVGPIGALTVDQSIRLNPARSAVADPAIHGATVFTDLLRARGVSVAAGPGLGFVPPNAPDVADIDSAPLRDIVGQMLSQSDNLTAEVLVKAMGYEENESGTTRAGLDAMSRALQLEDGTFRGIALADGSGLDRGDRISCGALTGLLADIRDVAAVRNGLPRAGESGTLEQRMTNSAAVGRVQAKTGTLNDVSALSGFVTPSDRAEMTFAMIVNGIDSSAAERLEDRIAIALASLPPLPSLVAYAPDRVED